MPSEKSRYRNRHLAPAPPIDFHDLKHHLVALGAERLAGIAWSRAQSDEVLSKTLMVAATIRLPDLNWDKAKSAIDYAFHFPDYVRYTEDGHGMILSEIRASAEFLAAQNNNDLALRIAQYAIKRGQEVAENFEEDFDWSSSIDDLSEWVQRMQA